MDKKLKKMLSQKAVQSSDTDELREALREIINEESSKPLNEGNSDLIDEATKMFFSLGSPSSEVKEEFIQTPNTKNTFNVSDKSSSKERKLRPKKASEKTKSRHIKSSSKLRRLKMGSIIAVFSAILLMATVTAYEFNFDIEGLTAEILESLPRGEYIKTKDGGSAILSDNFLDYTSLDLLYKDYPFLLTLDKIPDGYTPELIRATDYGKYIQTRIIFKNDRGDVFTVHSYKSADPVSESFKSLLQRIGNFDAVYSTYDGIHQAVTIYNDYTYVVKTPSFELLEEIMSNINEP